MVVVVVTNYLVIELLRSRFVPVVVVVVVLSLWCVKSERNACVISVYLLDRLCLSVK